MQCGIVELKFGQSVAKRIVLVGFHRIKTGKHLALGFFKARERFFCRFCGIGHGVADAGVFQLFNAGNDKTYLTGRKLGLGLRLRCKNTDLFNQMVGTCGHQANLVFRFNRAVNNANQHDDADIVVKPRVDDQRLQRSGRIALRCGNTLNYAFENLIDTHAGFCRCFNRVGRIQTDHIFDFFFGLIRIGALQVHLVEHRKNFYTKLNRRVAVGYGLRFNPLSRVNHKKSAFAGGQGTADFIAEVNVSRGINQI